MLHHACSFIDLMQEEEKEMINIIVAFCTLQLSSSSLSNLGIAFLLNITYKKRVELNSDDENEEWKKRKGKKIKAKLCDHQGKDINYEFNEFQVKFRMEQRP
ncbi:hypothetical protein BLOT_008860 [Blomia tropicalis]|nr:hypothetical protein BLOT_008860 [Blomia tropicalis]